MSVGYRQEIDGLRAFAVMPVIAFHAGFEALGGGYVGVDIFFVISGYLITSILIRELDAGQFSVLRFYQRRARRILPALVFVILCCLPFAWAWMFPAQLVDFAQSLAAVGLFGSNILFWRETGYFEASAELKPLLHTWSLAVEEQYYVIFPLLLLLTWRFGRRSVFYLVLGCAVLSLGLSEWGWRNAPSGNFYLAPTRAWELLAGSLCAFALQGRGQMSNALLAALGLAGIVFSILYYDKNTPFPSIYALLPVGGTALIILFAGPGTSTARFLSWRGFVGIGLISYSAYLWHQPLFAFARIRSLHEPSPVLMAGLGLASLLLAWLTWRFVEQPFRKPGKATIWASSRVTLWTAGSVSVALIAGGLGGWQAARSFNVGVADVTVPGLASDPRVLECLVVSIDVSALPDWGRSTCRFSATEANRVGRAMVMGDSHLFAMAGPVIDQLLESGYDVTLAAIAGCGPFRGYEKAGLSCGAAIQDLLTFVEQENFDLIVTSFRPQPFFLEPFDNHEGGVELDQFPTVYFDASVLSIAQTASDQEKMQALVRRGLAEILSWGADVVLFDPVPEAGWNVPDMMLKRQKFDPNGVDELVSTSAVLFEERNGPIIDVLDAMEAPNFYRVRPYDILCNRPEAPGRCLNTLEGQALYQDDDHLSFAGAQLLLPAFEAQLDVISAKNRP